MGGLRGSLPKLSLKFPSAPMSAKPSPPPIPSPPSAGTPPSSSSSKTGTPQPMTPPARLHLRSILPASPECLPTPPPPPPTPRPFIWQCHSCLSIWRLGTTRRCLVCTHEYCTSTQGPSSGRRVVGRKRRRNGPGSGGHYCAAEFDYKGWEEWGAWRRKVLGVGEAEATQAARDRAFLHAKHNCFRDCDYPSQCHHERVEISARIAAEAAASGNVDSWWRLQTVAEEPEVSPRIVDHPVTSPDDDLLMNEAIDIAQEIDQEMGEEPKSPTSPKSPLGQSSFFPDSASIPAPPKPKKQVQWWRPATEEESRALRARGPAAKTTKSGRVTAPLGLSPYEKARASGGKLTVRNTADDPEVTNRGSAADGDAEEDEGVDEFFSDGSDGEDYEMAESDLKSFADPRSQEQIESDLRQLIEASKKFWRE